MPSELENLVTDVIAATGAAPPAVLAGDSPALSIADDRDLYMIGLIGGKDVGKSSLVNAIVGLPISRTSATGAGTDRVIAYAHSSAFDRLQQQLQAIAPGRFEIIPHDNARLARQVLLDLPDIDSVYADHVELTRRMLRHLLFPIWLQSVEKYADQQPQQLLARVAEGNDPENFLFAINKVDLLASREGEPAVRELCDDYAKRVARTLGLARPPRVYALSAEASGKYDFPALRETMAQDRPQQDVSRSIALAGRQRDRTLLLWLDQQQLGERAARAERAFREADELVRERLAGPVLETALPRLLDNASYRAALVEPAIARRLARWPIIGAINTLATPTMTFIRRSLSTGGHVPAVDAMLDVDSFPLPQRIATTFAHLQQTNPAISPAYTHRKLWEELPARAAAAQLRDRLRATAERQSDAILQRAGGRTGLIAPWMRMLLTIGAILWFPLLQPLVATGLSAAAWDWTTMARKVVDVLSATHLLQASTFLLLWFGVLWVTLRWAAMVRADRLLNQWRRTASGDDPDVSFAAQIMQWTDDLLAPLGQARQRYNQLSERVADAHDLHAQRDAA